MNLVLMQEKAPREEAERRVKTELLHECLQVRPFHGSLSLWKHILSRDPSHIAFCFSGVLDASAEAFATATLLTWSTLTAA